jgi:hypothetical protein
VARESAEMRDRRIDVSGPEDSRLDPPVCCDDLRYHVLYRCPQHHDPYDCPDNTVVWVPAGYFGLPIHDGGSSHVVIRFCPWCGARLPEAPD